MSRFEVQDHVVHLVFVLVIGVVANAATECGQRDGGGKLPVRVINLDNPYGSPGIRCFSRCRGGVQEIEFCSDVFIWVVPKLKQGEIISVPDVKRKPLELRAGSGLAVENPIDMGVRDGAENSPGVRKSPKWPAMCRCVTPCLGPVRVRSAGVGNGCSLRVLRLKPLAGPMPGVSVSLGQSVDLAGQLSNGDIVLVPAPVITGGGVVVHCFVPPRIGLGIGECVSRQGSVNDSERRHNRL